MTDEELVARIEQAYREPAAGLDRATITRAALGTLDAADRRRRLVLAGSAVLGTSIAAAGVIAVGGIGGPLVIGAETALAAATEALSELTTAWGFGLVGLVLTASAISRSLEDF